MRRGEPHSRIHDGLGLRTSALSLLVLILVSTPAPVVATDNDYLPYNTSWNGLSGLDAMARASGTHLELLEQLSWDALPAGASLIVIHPRTEMKMARVKPFVEQGGRLLVADDFGQAKALLESFHIRRMEQGVRAEARLDGNPNLPVARKGPVSHALTAGVSEIATNHPAYFLSPYSTLAGFGKGVQQVLVAGKVGKGQLIALSDPSVLINAMLPWSDNRRFARNLVAALRPKKGQPIYLVTGYFKARGAVKPGGGPSSGAVPKLLTEFNGFLAMFGDYALLEPGLRALGIICGGFAVLALFLLLPFPRRDLDGHWIRPQGPPPSGLEEDVGRGGTAFPASVLREEVEEILGDLIKAPGPLSTIHPRWVVNRVKVMVGQEPADLCARLLSSLKKLPQTSAVTSNSVLRGPSFKELDNIYRLSSDLFTRLGAPPLPGPQKQRQK